MFPICSGPPAKEGARRVIKTLARDARLLSMGKRKETGDNFSQRRRILFTTWL